MNLSHVPFVGVLPSPRPTSGPRLESARGTPGRESAGLAEAPTEQVDPFVRWLLGQAGIDGSMYRPSPMQRRTAACLRQLGVTSVAAAQRRIEETPVLLRRALNALLIGVSGFFRDSGVYEVLRSHVIPALARSGRPIRVASVGCSEGQELYSVAMLLAEAGKLDQADLWGFDCRPDAVLAASRGRYRSADLNMIDAERRARFFVSQGDEWAVRGELRRRTQWRVSDISAFSSPLTWDLVLLRNVTIYFQPEPAAATWARWASRMTPHAFLVTGSADQPGEALGLRRCAPCIYQKGGS